MKRSTPIPITPQPNPVDYHSNTLFLGSCFAVNMAERFDFYSLPMTANPFGVLFHPLAIENLVSRALNQQEFNREDLSQRDDIWYSFEAHSSLSGIEQKAVLEDLNTALGNLKKALETATHVVLTLGTSWVYRHIASDSIVANCHKEPDKLFQKELLTPLKIQNSLESIVREIRAINPGAVFIFTVSPVRHTKDGMVENARSKAHLLTGVHDCKSANDNCYYFPAYEIMMDELRDYRYYNSDLVHPNNQAIFYIWEQFKTAWITPETESLLEEIGGLKAAMNHKTQIPGSNAHREFQRKLAERLEEFRQQHPHIQI